MKWCKKPPVAHHQLTDAQPVPEQWQPQPACLLPAFLLLSVTSYDMEYPFGQLGSAVPAVPPPSFLCTPSLLTDGVVCEAEKTLTLYEHCSAVPKTSLCYQRCFGHKSKA